MSRLEDWVAHEIAQYEHTYGRMSDDDRTRYKDMLEGTLHGAQLRVADAAGDLGDAVLTALKDHSDRARDRSLREWFRRHW